MPRHRPPLKDIMRLTGLSRATVDRALNARDGVRPVTLAAVEAAVASLQQAESIGTTLPAAPSSQLKKFKFVIQADDEFTQSIIEQTAILSAGFAAKGCQLEVVPFTNRTADLVARSAQRRCRGRSSPYRSGGAGHCRSSLVRWCGGSCRKFVCCFKDRFRIEAQRDAGCRDEHGYRPPRSALVCWHR